MISVLKSELKPQGAAKMLNSGISFKAMSKLIGKGTKMVHMNRILENKTLSDEETTKLLKSKQPVAEIVTKMATVGNGKLFYQMMAQLPDPIVIGQAIKEWAWKNKKIPKSSKNAQEISKILEKTVEKSQKKNTNSHPKS